MGRLVLHLMSYLPWMLLSLGAVPAHAAGTKPFKVAVCVSVKGLDPGIATTVRSNVQANIEYLGGQVVTPTQGPADGGCCITPACLQQEHARQVAAVLVVDILRFGPVVRMSTRSYNTATRSEVMQLSATAQAQEFSVKVSFLSDLERALQPFGAQRPQPKPAPAPSPPPEKDGTTKPQPKVTVAPSGKEDPAGGVDFSLPPPPVVIVMEEPKSSRGTFLWLGGSLAVGGAALAGTGIALLLGPMKSYINTRDAKYLEWSHEPPGTTLKAQLEAEWTQAEDRARTFYYAGWILGGAGAALCVGGAIVLLLTPSDSARGNYPPTGVQFAPMRVDGGGGLVLGWSW